MNDTKLSQLKRDYHMKKLLCQNPSLQDKEDLDQLRRKIKFYDDQAKNL